MYSKKTEKEKCSYEFEDIITRNSNMKNAIGILQKTSNTDSPVLIYGETGTGKELFVQAIHNASPRKRCAFIAINCAAIPENLFEMTLFGATKGSYTGAFDKKGLFELADGGTLYLDELNSMPYEIQSKLLRVIQEGKVRRVGDYKEKQINVRLITTLNEYPEELLEKQKLRKDLYYRLNVIRIDIPPLRERKEDIEILSNYFIKNFNTMFNNNVVDLKKEALWSLTNYNWPGNVRQLENLIQAIFNFKSEGYIGVEDIAYVDESIIKYGRKPLKEVIEEVEINYIKEALSITEGNVSKASELLGIPRQTLQYKIKKYLIKY